MCIFTDWNLHVSGLRRAKRPLDEKSSEGPIKKTTVSKYLYLFLH
jgi:hypothetical protein